MFHMYLLPTVTYGVSITVFPFTMFTLLQRPIPVLSLFRHFQCNHWVSVPGTRSSDGIDVSLCGTYRMWWVHALSLSAGGFY